MGALGVSAIDVRRPDLRRRAATGAVLVGGLGVLMGLVSTPEVTWTFVASAVLVFGFTPVAGAIAHRLGAVSHPGGRAHHAESTPSMGGLAVVLPIVALLVYRSVTGGWGGPGTGVGLGGQKAFGLLLAVLLATAAGMQDDARGIRARLKLLVQVTAALCLVLSGWRLPEVRLPIFGPVELGLLEVPLILFWVVLVSNAFNLIDGLDGLATCVAILGCGAFALMGPEGLLTAIVGGACVGFLPHNLPRARIFLGDTGSLPLGLILAALALDVRAEANFAIALGALSFPLGDLAFSILRRSVRGKPLFAADQGHVHHRAAAYLGNDPAALLVLILIAALPIVATLARPGLVSLGLTAGLWLGIAVFVVLAGRYRLQPILTARRSIRKLHIVRRYVSGALEIARDPAEVDMLLRHMVEATGLHALEVGGRIVRPASPPDDADARWHPVQLDDGEARWLAPSLGDDAALAAERATVVVDLVREAADRLRVVLEEGGEGDAAIPDPEPVAPELVSK